MANPQRAVKLDRSGVFGIADHGHHLVKPGRATCGYQFSQKRPADSASGHLMMNIDAVLEGQAIGFAGLVPASIGITDNLAVHFRHQRRIAIL